MKEKRHFSAFDSEARFLKSFLLFCNLLVRFYDESGKKEFSVVQKLFCSDRVSFHEKKKKIGLGLS